MVQRLLDASANLPAFVNDLLTTQAVVVAGTEAAGFLIDRPDDERMGLRLITHIRPDESDEQTRAAAVKAFQNLIQPCIVQNKDGAIEVGSPDGGEPQFCLVTLLRNEGQLVAASAVITRCRDLERARQRLGSMQLVAGYFDLYTLRRASDQSREIAQRHQHVLQYASSVATAEGFESAAMNLCNELANRTAASRVAIGWVKRQTVKVRALSHTEKFDKKQDLIVQLQKVMEECLDQEEPVRYDPAGECSPNVTRQAKAFSQQQAGVVVMSLPLRRRDEIKGVLTLEFLPQNKPDEHTQAALGVASELLAPTLFDRHENDRLIFVKMGHSVTHGTKLLLGPKHMVAKLVVMLVIAAIAFVTFFKPMYHVSAPFQLQASLKQQMCAPFDGQLAESVTDANGKEWVSSKEMPRPGQFVHKGDILAAFDTTEMRSKLAQAQATVVVKDTVAKGYLSDGTKQAERKIAEAEREEAQAQVDLYDEEISKAIIRAPFDGVVLKGDLIDQLHVTKKQGEPLFEVAEAAENKIIKIEAELAVSERDIQEIRKLYDLRAARTAATQPSGIDLASGATTQPAALAGKATTRPALAVDDVFITEDGKLATSSFPGDDFKFRITRIVPVGDPKEGENSFKVYATVIDPAAWMHPGMAGEARVNVEKRRLAWIWTHRLVDFVRLKLWI